MAWAAQAMVLLLSPMWPMVCRAEKQDKELLPPMRRATLTDYAEHKNGADWAPAIAKAFADCDQLYVPSGNYSCSEVRLLSGKSIVGEGDKTVFIPLDSHLFVIEGKIGPEIKITSDIADFSDAILLERPGGLKPGDDILIRGQRNAMLREGATGVNYSTDWVLGRTRRSSCFFGEMDVVASVTGNQIVTANKRIFPDYFKDDSREPPGIGAGFLFRKATTVSKLSMVTNAALRRLAITGTRTCFMPVKLSYCKDCVVEHITFRTSTASVNPNGIENLSVVYGLYAWNTAVRDFKAVLSPSLLTELNAKEKVYVNFSNYNLFKMISSTGSGFERCEANGGTHAFNITRSASAKGRGGIPSVNGYIRDCTASNCIWSGVTVQQACYNTELSGNTVTASGQGIITGGRNTIIAGNTVDTDLPYTTDYYYTHIARGGTFGIGLIEGYACGSIVSNNTINNFYSGITIADGYESKNCFEEGRIIVEDNTVTNCLRGFSLYKNPHCQKLGCNDLAITIRRNTFTRLSANSVDVSGKRTDSCGVYLPDASAGINIERNIFRNFTHGVWMDKQVDAVAVTGNRFEANGCGITLTAPANPGGRRIRIRHSDNTFAGTEPQTDGLNRPGVTSL